MANIKISQLNEFTGDTTSAFVVINDSLETATYKVRKEKLIAIPSAGFSWTNNGSYNNLTNFTDNYIPFNTTIFNTSPGLFQFVNSGGSNQTAPASIFVGEAGVYEITGQAHFYDIFGEIDIVVKISSSPTAIGGFSPLTALHDYKSNENGADQTMNGTVLIELTQPTYLSMCIFVDQQTPGNLPYPSDADNTPTRIFIKKLS
jgi:hypothetical protein